MHQYDAIIISDLHLGARNCEAKRIRKFLHRILRGKITTSLLIIAGDAFDKQDTDRLRKRHWKVLKLLKKIGRITRVIDLIGNHDEDADFNTKYIGAEAKTEHIFVSGGKKVYVSHGHAHDEFLDKHPLMTNVADAIYGFTQFVDPTHWLAKELKRKSKKFLKVARRIGLGVAAAARRNGCEIAVHGHNHHAGFMRIDGVDVWDSGCWTEKPCTFWTIKDGEAQLHEFKKK